MKTWIKSAAVPACAAASMFATVCTDPGVSVAEDLALHLVVENGEIAGGAPTLRATEGDRVTITMVSDDGMEIHLHGYDLSAKLVANETALLVFDANIVGRFPAEPHTHGGDHSATLFYIEVYPN